MAVESKERDHYHVDIPVVPKPGAGSRRRRSLDSLGTSNPDMQAQMTLSILSLFTSVPLCVCM